VHKSQPSAPRGALGKKVPSEQRKLQILKAAEAEFASTGLHATTSLALARSAGISKALLFAHFDTKESLFKEVVQSNIETRLSALQERIRHIRPGTPAQCVQSLAEFTVVACASGSCNAILTAWALLEAPEYAVDLHRNEIGAIRALWETEMAARFPESANRVWLGVHLIPYAVDACQAFGLWLSSLRHSSTNVAAHARLYAAGIGLAALGILNTVKEESRL